MVGLGSNFNHYRSYTMNIPKVTIPAKNKAALKKVADFAKNNWREIAVAAVTILVVEDLDDIADLVDE